MNTTNFYKLLAAIVTISVVGAMGAFAYKTLKSEPSSSVTSVTNNSYTQTAAAVQAVAPKTNFLSEDRIKEDIVSNINNPKIVKVYDTVEIRDPENNFYIALKKARYFLSQKVILSKEDVIIKNGPISKLESCKDSDFIIYVTTQGTENFEEEGTERIKSAVAGSKVKIEGFVKYCQEDNGQIYLKSH
jgi:hypothetical protein